jgi:molybdenum cofactor cytidylyltransferase
VSRPKVALAVLAAGSSTRLGQPKQLLDVDGQPLLTRTLDAGRRSRLEPKLLILGHAADQIQSQVTTHDYQVIENTHAHTGQASSLKAALRALPDDAAGVVIALGDQPLVPPGLLDRLADAFNPETDAAVRPQYADGPGNPLLLGRSLFAELCELIGDVGARDVLRANAARVRSIDEGAVPTPRDVDTWDDYAALLRNWTSLGGPEVPAYCQRCGSPVGQRELYGRLRPHCPSCAFTYFYDPKLATAVIVEIDGRIVMQRRAVDPGAGKWSLPSGFVDRGEVVTEAAAREVFEEVGLIVQELQSIGFYSEPGATVTLAVFAAGASGQQPVAGDETSEVMLAEPEALPELAFPRDERIIADWLSWRSARP